MNHQKIYDNIIIKVKSENRIKHNGNYYENHHIIPKCLDGGEEKENKVLLTAREHFVCHKLLTYIYKGNYKIYHAFHLMTFMNKRKYGITSRDYAYAIELYKSIPSYQENKTYYELYILKYGETMGIEKYNTWLQKKKTQIPWNKNKVNVYSQETLKLMKIPKTKKHIQNIKEAAKNRPQIMCQYCNKSMTNQNYSRWHKEICKYKTFV